MSKIQKPNKKTMPVHLYNTKMKLYFEQTIKEINKQAHNFYIEKKTTLLDYYITQEIWTTSIWNKAKQIHQERNEFHYGKLTCEYCMKEIKIPYFKNFQLHHKNLYNWENLFGSEEILIIHKECHKKLHNDLKHNKKIKGDQNG